VRLHLAHPSSVGEPALTVTWRLRRAMYLATPTHQTLLQNHRSTRRCIWTSKR
jgi:hypothetical protein